MSNRSRPAATRLAAAADRCPCHPQVRPCQCRRRVVHLCRRRLMPHHWTLPAAAAACRPCHPPPLPAARARCLLLPVPPAPATACCLRHPLVDSCRCRVVQPLHWHNTGPLGGCGRRRRAHRVRTGAVMSQTRCCVFARRVEVAFPLCRAGWRAERAARMGSSLFPAGKCTWRRRACKSRRRSSPVRPVRGAAPSAMGGVRPERLIRPNSKPYIYLRFD